mmetsp:Transcript_3295/g.5778  ORF Transcript_3295/g.5778 Transcript_3295/m.5778 type:complete len:450 (-) Transcript_3295:206-1555(-)|eukprot:CAMPEP_0182447658 /NCGR_PEP_ID=MMETSP1172-20130603/18465_1 /TAXON_ID=708627 /ORGANISM="Timspurckia oligopyrenoides, Strain CCMP3278" /LENGTH=449 /DNA_ID=CAMNT_0024644175 /DNA_START=25 /DNA_END=1374 /DNA_ORIENTATION=-
MSAFVVGSGGSIDSTRVGRSVSSSFCGSAYAHVYSVPRTFVRGDLYEQFLIDASSSRRISNSSTRRNYSKKDTIRCDADYYSRLGVSRDADEKTLKKAYRQLARKYHPDVNDAPDAKETFQKITEAYEVLSDSNMRARYDQFGEAGVKGAAAGGGPGFSSDFGDFGPFSDMFETFFGGSGGGARSRSRRAGPVQGEDLRLEIELGFEKAVFGGDHVIRYSHLQNCSPCRGTGAKDGASRVSCGTCGGRGVVVQVARTPLGAFQTQSTCPTCQGEGETVKEFCSSCGGKGRTQVTKSSTVTVPPGVDSGSRLRVRGDGDDGIRGGPPGDLYVVLRIRPHPQFTREGMNIYARASISYLDAILGTTLEVPTLDGDQKLKIAPGTQPGTRLCIEGKGVPKLGNKFVRGDHYVTVDVVIPTKLSSEEKKLLTQLAEKSKSSSGSGEGFFKFRK